MAEGGDMKSNLTPLQDVANPCCEGQRDNPEAKDSGQPKDLITQQDNTQVEQLLAHGIDCLEKDKNKEALKHFTEAIQLDNNNPLLYINRAAAYARLMKYSDAMEDAETIVEMHPDWPEAYLRKGTIYLGEWRNRLAYCALRRGLEVDPENERLNRAFFESKTRMQMAKDGTNYPKPATHPLMDKSTHEELRQNPFTKDFMKDPKFVDVLNRLRRDPSLWLEMYNSDDKRYMVATTIARAFDVNAEEADWSDLEDPVKHTLDQKRFDYPYIERYDPVREVVVPPTTATATTSQARD